MSTGLRWVRAVVLASIGSTCMAGATFATPDVRCISNHDAAPRFANVSFTSVLPGPSGQRELIGNGFVVSATPLASCVDSGHNACLMGPPHVAKRLWLATIVTAAHVVTTVCAGSSAEWRQVDADRNQFWRPNSPSVQLVFQPGEKNAIDRDHAYEVTLDRDWCRRNASALTNDPRGDRTTAKTDVFAFQKVVALPVRSIMMPYAVAPAPKAAAVTVMGFRVWTDDEERPDGDFFGGNWKMIQADVSSEPHRVNSEVELSNAFDITPGRSGSAVVDREDLNKDGGVRVYGVLTNRSATVGLLQKCAQLRDEEDGGRPDEVVRLSHIEDCLSNPDFLASTTSVSVRGFMSPLTFSARQLLAVNVAEELAGLEQLAPDAARAGVVARAVNVLPGRREVRATTGTSTQPGARVLSAGPRVDAAVALFREYKAVEGTPAADEVFEALRGAMRILTAIEQIEMWTMVTGSNEAVMASDVDYRSLPGCLPSAAFPRR